MGTVTGTIRKMKTDLGDKVQYNLPIGDQSIDMNCLIGKKITLEFTGDIHCLHCGNKTKKSFSQGFCYPCTISLAQCDMCILKPETCHYHLGTCREPKWGEDHCMIPHFVYLANSSTLKVGITRHTQIPTRWIDQGAVEALPIFKVSSRRLSGLVETTVKEFMGDKTNWRKMLKGEVAEIDLLQERESLLPKINDTLDELRKEYGEESIEVLSEEVVKISFPVETYPTKITSFNFDKKPKVEGMLHGIKGQYLILDTGVLNIRKFGGYTVSFSDEG